MTKTCSAQSGTVWGDKAIQDELERILGFRPSLASVRRWSSQERANRLPVKHLEGSRLRCAEVIDLEKWRAENVK